MPENNLPYRVGLGFDIHRLKSGGGIILAGVNIPCSFSLQAVSDGDVVIHSLCDALCGAAGLGDIGDYFPPDLASSQKISGEFIARKIISLFNKRFKIINMDITIIADKPPLIRYKKPMRESLQKIFSTNLVNIKIKSKEALSILGGENSIVCFSVVSLAEEVC